MEGREGKNEEGGGGGEKREGLSRVLYHYITN